MFGKKQENGMCVPCIAFGQKGRCDMEGCKVPLFIVSLLGFGLLAGLNAPPAHADFHFGTPVHVGLSGYDDSYIVCGPCLSADGLELYFQREEPMNKIYVARRPTPDGKWGEPVKLGPAINTSVHEGGVLMFTTQAFDPRPAP